MYHLYTDGAYLSQYRKAGIGGYLEDPQSGILFEFSQTITEQGVLNFHEHLALENGLKMCLEHGIKEVKCFSDYKNFTKLFSSEYRIMNRLKELDETLILKEIAPELLSESINQVNTNINNITNGISLGLAQELSKKQKQKLKQQETVKNFEEIVHRINHLLMQFSQVEFCWIPRKENGKADKLSKPDLRVEMAQTNFIGIEGDSQTFSQALENMKKYYVFDCSHGLKIYECIIDENQKIDVKLVQEEDESAQKDKLRKIVTFLSSAQGKGFGISFRNCETGLLFKSTIERKISSKVLHSYVTSLEKIAREKKIVLHQNGRVLFACFGKCKKMIKTIDSCLDLMAAMGEGNKDIVEQYTGQIADKDLSQAQKNIFHILLSKINSLNKYSRLEESAKQWLGLENVLEDKIENEQSIGQDELIDKIKLRGINLKFKKL